MSKSIQFVEGFVGYYFLNVYLVVHLVVYEKLSSSILPLFAYG